MDDQRTAVLLALWAAWCGFVAAVWIGADGYGVVPFALLALGTIALAAIARRWIVVLAPLALSLPLGLLMAAVADEGFLSALAAWFGAFGLLGTLLAAVTVEVAVHRRPAEFQLHSQLQRVH